MVVRILCYLQDLLCTRAVHINVNVYDKLSGNMFSLCNNQQNYQLFMNKIKIHQQTGKIAKYKSVELFAVDGFLFLFFYLNELGNEISNANFVKCIRIIV